MGTQDRSWTKPLLQQAGAASSLAATRAYGLLLAAGGWSCADLLGIDILSNSATFSVLPEGADVPEPGPGLGEGRTPKPAADPSSCATDPQRRCIGAAPQGWLGPMALTTAATTAPEPTCLGTGYERRVFSSFGGLEQGAASCACSCEPPVVTCDRTVEMYSSNTLSFMFCTAQPVSTPVTLNVGDCTPVSSVSTYLLQDPPFLAEPCEPTLIETLPEARLTRRLAGCESDDVTALGCGEAELCVPPLARPLERWCVYRPDAVDCPEGPYRDKLLGHDEVSNTRSCTECVCGTPSGRCSPSVTFISSQGGDPCNPLLDTFEEADGTISNCVMVDSPRPVVATVAEPTAMVTCTPSGGLLQGAVTPSNPVTLCCLPPE